MRVIFLGTGFAVPEKGRAQAGILVEADENLLLFDCGAGVLGRIAESGRDVMDIEDIFLTHHHLDHDSDFLSIYKAQALSGRKSLNLYSPRGTEGWLDSIFEAYPYLKGRMELTIKEMANGTKVKLKGCLIESRKTEHTPDSLAYRISTPEASVVYSGDTAPCDGIARLCRDGVDLLIHECSLPDSENPEDHTTPASLSDFVSGLPVRRLAITHFSPQMKGREAAISKTISSHFKGEPILARDLQEVRL